MPVARMSSYLDVQSREIIYQKVLSKAISAIAVQYGTTVGYKTIANWKKSQEHSLHIIYGDYDSLYTDLYNLWYLLSAGTTMIFISTLEPMLVEVFKIIYNQNLFLDGIFQINQSSYSLRDLLTQQRLQPKSKYWCDNTVILRQFFYLVLSVIFDLTTIL